MSDVPSEVDNPLKESFIQRCAIYLAFGCFVIAAGAYAINFADWLNISDSTETWGQLGDYLGGLINPIVGLLTIWLLTVSLKQTHRELELTRKAVKSAESSQKATEDALQAQIGLAKRQSNIQAASMILESHSRQIREMQVYLKNEGKEVDPQTYTIFGEAYERLRKRSWPLEDYLKQVEDEILNDFKAGK